MNTFLRILVMVLLILTLWHVEHHEVEQAIVDLIFAMIALNISTGGRPSSKS